MMSQSRRIVSCQQAPAAAPRRALFLSLGVAGLGLGLWSVWTLQRRLGWPATPARVLQVAMRRSTGHTYGLTGQTRSSVRQWVDVRYEYAVAGKVFAGVAPEVSVAVAGGSWSERIPTAGDRITVRFNPAATQFGLCRSGRFDQRGS